MPKDAGDKTFFKISQFSRNRKKSNYGEILTQLQTTMTEQVGVFRTEEGISTAIEKIKELYETTQNGGLSSNCLIMNPEIMQRLELENILHVSMVIAYCALNRRETRGAHARVDFPKRKDEFNHHTLAKMDHFGDISLGERTINMDIFKARGEYYNKFDYIERKY